MKWYWGKIALTALAIFGVGFGVINVVRATKRQVVSAVQTNADLTIPLPFLPFNVNGTKVGAFRKVVLHRSSPEAVESVDATVRLTDLAVLETLKGCSVTVEDPSRLSENSSFRCAADSETGMTAFGTLIVMTHHDGDWTKAAVFPLVLAPEVAQKIRGKEAEHHAAELEATRFRTLGDSLQALATSLRRATADSVREVIESEMESLDDEMRGLRESMSETAAERTADSPPAEAAVSISNGKVTVTSPDRTVTVGPGGVTVLPSPPKPSKAPPPAKAPRP